MRKAADNDNKKSMLSCGFNTFTDKLITTVSLGYHLVGGQHWAAFEQVG